MNDTCYTTEKIQKDLVDVYIQFVYQDSYVDLGDFNNPIRPFLNSDILQGSAQASRVDAYYYKVYNIITDSGLIMSDKVSFDSYQLEQKNSYLTPLNFPNIFRFIVSISNIKDNYERKYVKIQQVLANTGGFIKFILIFSIFFNNFISAKFMLAQIFYSLEEKYHHYFKGKEGKLPVKASNIGSTRANNFINQNDEKESNLLFIFLDRSTHQTRYSEFILNEKNPNSFLNINIEKKIKKKRNFKKFNLWALFSIFKGSNSEYKEQEFILDRMFTFYKKNLDVIKLILNNQKSKILNRLIFGAGIYNIKKALFSHLLMSNFNSILIKNNSNVDKKQLKSGRGIIELNQIVSDEFQKITNNMENPSLI
jgi:hypothetical protein